MGHSSDSPLRLLGLSMDPTIDPAGEHARKNTGLFAALGSLCQLVGSVRPEVPPLALAAHRLRRFHPRRARWRHRVNAHPSLFRARSAVAEQLLGEREGEYDLIVQLHTTFAPGLRPGSRPFVLHTDNTYMLSERGHPPWAPLHGRARDAWIRLEREVYQQAAFVFPRSEWLRRSLIDDYGCDPDRVVRVGGGANLRRPDLVGRRWDQQVAVFVGQDWARKGGPELIEAWGSVRRALPRARLRVAGIERPPWSLPAGVEWIGVVRDREQMRSLYEHATVFVMPSRFEPWGHVFLEAMGMGLPCVGSDCCAMSEIIRPGTGLLVPPRAPAPLAEALVALLGDPELARRLGETAWRSVDDSGTWDAVATRIVPYLEVAAGR